jgi:ribosomal protein L37AE/L43A
VMEDYPKTIEEFEARFSSEEACREYLMQLRWPEGFRCPRCNDGKAWKVSDTLWQCGQCGHQTSVTAGTVFQDTRKPLKTWFRAMWYVMCQKNGASALGCRESWGWVVIRRLGLGFISYDAPWSDPGAIVSRAGLRWMRHM